MLRWNKGTLTVKTDPQYPDALCKIWTYAAVTDVDKVGVMVREGFGWDDGKFSVHVGKYMITTRESLAEAQEVAESLVNALESA